MTEDVFVTQAAREAAMETGGWFMPQCGLAPGVVSILAMRLVDQLGVDVTDRRVEIRVGALPRTASNHIKYYLTWSSEGLVNEYNNPCHAIVDGQPVDLVPLEGVEQLSIDGAQYEAFNTSGGLGTLRDTLQGYVTNLNYKTMRYPGHRDYFHFLLSDLGLSKRMPVLVDILNQSVPHVRDDVIVITIHASGKDATRGWVNGEQYTNKIYGQDGLNAIQLTTAAGLCAAVHWWSVHTQDEAKGFRKSEDIPWDFFTASPFSKPYLEQAR
jgi:saccharopine dehydrogenase-like NADP-dependent oxidoreductase